MPWTAGFGQRSLQASRCIGIFLESLPLFLRLRFSGNAAWRGVWAQWISDRFLRLIDGKVHITGTVPKSGLIVCNHLSYLDILVLLKACPAAFVAKKEVRRWEKRSLAACVRFGPPHEPVQERKQHAVTLRLAVIQLRNAGRENVPRRFARPPREERK